MTRRLSAPVAVLALALILPAPSCALRSKTIGDAALSLGEVVLQIDAAERVIYESGKLDNERHKLNGQVIIRLLYAAQAFERAAAAKQDGKAQRAEVAGILDDLAQISIDLPEVSAAIAGARRFLTEP